MKVSQKNRYIIAISLFSAVVFGNCTDAYLHQMKINELDSLVIVNHTLQISGSIEFKIPKNVYVQAVRYDGGHNPLRIYTYNGGYVYFNYPSQWILYNENQVLKNGLELRTDLFGGGLGAHDTLILRMNDVVCKEYVRDSLIIGYLFAKEYEEELFDSIIFSAAIIEDGTIR